MHRRPRPTSVSRPDAIYLKRLARDLRQLLKPAWRIAAGQRGKEASGRQFGQHLRLEVAAAYRDKADPVVVDHGPRLLCSSHERVECEQVAGEVAVIRPASTRWPADKDRR